MILLSDADWSSPRIEGHLKYHAKTVRLALEHFNQEQLPSLRHHHPGPAPDVDRREQVTAILDRLLEQDRTWMAAQLAESLGEEGIHLGTRQTRKHLQRMAPRRRTSRTLCHKQDRERVEQARSQPSPLKRWQPRASSS